MSDKMVMHRNGQDETVCILICANALKKGMNPPILPTAMNKLQERLGRATGQEGKILISK